MSDERLEHLAKAAGLSIEWVDADGREQRVEPEALRAVLGGLGLAAETDEQIEQSLEQLHLGNNPSDLPPLMTADMGAPLSLKNFFEPHTPYSLEFEEGSQQTGKLDSQACLAAIDTPGYHQLRIVDQTLTIAVAPPACPSVEEVAGPSAWGITVQLYSLRRPGDGGLGDTLALETLARSAAAHGAQALGISPVHAMFFGRGDQYSPYSPSSRLFYNVLYSAPAAILGELPLRQAIEACGIEAQLQQLEQLELVDWTAVSETRRGLLRTLYEHFSTGGNALEHDFASFRQAAGEALENHCRFEALHAALLDEDGHTQHWRQWPEQYRAPANPAVQAFAEEQADEISFHAFCQWLIARGLERAQAAARGAGMGIGLISDLAVGADGGGSQAWSRQEEVLAALSVGAPPDILNRSGQNWGIAAFSPWGLRANGYRAFIEMLRANLAHAGGMRIDHVMGLMRLWVMPAGASPEQGAYLNYPFDDMLRLLTLEAWRHNAVILGEDLGTVPEGLREKLAARRILGMRVLLFEQDQMARFTPPSEWSADALATTTTHDLPTIKGWWLAQDIDWRIRVGQNREEDRQQQTEARERERRGLNAALRPYAPEGAGEQLAPASAVQASACFIGSTPAPLALLPMEDILGLLEQPNLPGIVDAHPNWRRRYCEDSATLLDNPQSTQRLQCLAEARRKAQGEKLR